MSQDSRPKGDSSVGTTKEKKLFEDEKDELRLMSLPYVKCEDVRSLDSLTVDACAQLGILPEELVHRKETAFGPGGNEVNRKVRRRRYVAYEIDRRHLWERVKADKQLLIEHNSPKPKPSHKPHPPQKSPKKQPSHSSRDSSLASSLAHTLQLNNPPVTYLTSVPGDESNDPNSSLNNENTDLNSSSSRSGAHQKPTHPNQPRSARSRPLRLKITQKVRTVILITLITLVITLLLCPVYPHDVQ